MPRRPKAFYGVTLFCTHFCEKHEAIVASDRADAARQGQDRLDVWIEENDRNETDKCAPGTVWISGPYEDSERRIPGEGYAEWHFESDDDEWHFESDDDEDPPRP